MTAISLNHTPAQSIDIAGIPLDGLPPLEAGRTLPQAFAELLNKSGKPGDETPVDGEAKPKEGGTEQADKAEGATGTGATGKTLPYARLEIAAMQAPESPIEDLVQAAEVPTETPKESAAGAPGPLDIEAAAAEAASRMEAAAQPGMAVVSIAATQAGVAADLAQPKGLARAGAFGASSTLSVTASIAEKAPTQAGQDSANAQHGHSSGGQGEHAAQPNARALSDQARSFANSQTVAAQGALAQSTAAQGNPAQGNPAQAMTQQATAAQTAAAQDIAQTGISLQVRAADKAFAEMTLASTASAPSTATGSVIAAPLASQPILASTALGAPQPGMTPQFTELAALVDRIEAARASTGNASTTISLAHKELGNLALTFETSGRSLAVEVAARDSEMQRSLAAAIAADKPHVRTTEAQAQTPQSQLAGSSQGGSSDARGSAMTGDAQSDRRGDPRNASRQGGSGDEPKSPKPKSDGGIYA